MENENPESMPLALPGHLNLLFHRQLIAIERVEDAAFKCKSTSADVKDSELVKKLHNLSVNCRSHLLQSEKDINFVISMVEVVSERFMILKEAMDKKKMPLARSMLELIQKEIENTEKYYLERTKKCQEMMEEAISLRFYEKLEMQLLATSLANKENCDKEIIMLTQKKQEYEDNLNKYLDILKNIDDLEKTIAELNGIKTTSKEYVQTKKEEDQKKDWTGFLNFFRAYDQSTDEIFKGYEKKESKLEKNRNKKLENLKSITQKTTTEINNLSQMKLSYDDNLKRTRENLTTTTARIDNLNFKIKEYSQMMETLATTKDASKEYLAVIQSLLDVKTTFEVASSKWSQFQIWINIMKGRVETNKNILDAGELTINVQQSIQFLNQISIYCRNCKKDIDQYRSNSLNLISESSPTTQNSPLCLKEV